MDWRRINEIPEQFDCVMCRGNSLSHVVSWNVGNPHPSKGLIIESLKKMAERIKDKGLLYVDTITQKEIKNEGGSIKIDLGGVNLVGTMKHDKKNKLRYIEGHGIVHGKKFSGGTVSYLLSPDELVDILKEIGMQEIFSPRLYYEKNYTILCARK
jgi:hypothetical protein